MTQGELGWRAGWMTGLVAGCLMCTYMDFIRAHAWWFIGVCAAAVIVSLALDIWAARALRTTRAGKGRALRGE